MEMPSKLRSETARLNGAKSRGPKTAAGKEISSQNALQHGFTSQSVIVLACESQSQFDELLNQFMEIHKPANAAEIDLVEEMVACRWRIRRMWGIETTLMDAEILNQESQSGGGAGNRVYMAQAFKFLSDDSRSLVLAARYQSRLHRTFNQAYATLRELQQMRESKPPASPPPVVGPAQPAPAPPDLETAKGTQAPTNPPESNQMPPDPPATTHHPQPTAHYPTL
jgi:hypothetical protein